MFEFKFVRYYLNLWSVYCFHASIRYIFVDGYILLHACNGAFPHMHAMVDPRTCVQWCLRHFWYHRKMVACSTRDNCFEVVQFDSQLPPAVLHSTLGRGIENSAVCESRRKVFGKSSVKVPSASLGRMWIDEIAEPFYVFQLASIALWFWEDYAQYAWIVLVLTLFSSCYDLASAR